MALQIASHKLIPWKFQALLSGKLAEVKLPKRVMSRIINTYNHAVGVDTSDYDLQLPYPNFQSYFVRPLKPGRRAIASQSLVSPCDSLVTSCGRIKQDQLYQVKGKEYTLAELVPGVGSGLDLKPYINGQFATFYLSPADYHRVHAPVDGQLVQTLYVPGQKYPVNHYGRTQIERLYCVNERLISVLKDGQNRGLIMVNVGAGGVSKVVYSHAELNAAFEGKAHQVVSQNFTVTKGHDLARFLLGSTVVLLLDETWPQLNLNEGQIVKLGEALLK